MAKSDLVLRWPNDRDSLGGRELKEVDGILGETLGAIFSITCQCFGNGGEAIGRQGSGNNEDTDVWPTVFKEPRCQHDEMAAIASDEAATLGGGQPQLLLVAETVSPTLVRAEDIQAVSAAYLSYPPG